MRGGEEEKGATYNTVCTLTETVILQTISSGNGPFSFFCSRSRHVAISSMNTQTSFCAGVECEGGSRGDVWRCACVERKGRDRRKKFIAPTT